MSTRGSITLGELEGKLTMLEVSCHRCERSGRVTLARLIEEHGADTGLPDLWESLAGDCQHARSTALNNRCTIYYTERRGQGAAQGASGEHCQPPASPTRPRHRSR